MFPSPLGEMGLSISTGMKSRNGWTASFGFPSPLGEMGLSIKMESSRFPSLSKFPSPLGEMGLSINVRLRVKRWLICVSVPSRGNGVIDLNRAIYNHFCFRRVSVPSRGNGVIDQKGFRRGSRRARWFPSPLGEMGLSIWNEMRHFAAGMRFPSPLGEMGLSIHDVAARKRVPSPSFRPLSGKWGYRYGYEQLQRQVSGSFRPLSGKWGYRFDIGI